MSSGFVSPMAARRARLGLRSAPPCLVDLKPLFLGLCQSFTGVDRGVSKNRYFLGPPVDDPSGARTAAS